MRIFSFGGGVQSTASLVLAAQGKIDYRTFLFCNVGEDSEHPDTLQYVREVAMPYAQQHGIELIELQKTRFGKPDSIYSALMRPNRSVGIPVRMNGNGAPGNRSCTADFKIKVVDKWLKAHGAKETGAVVGLGISLDEFQRVKANTDPGTLAWKQNSHPLIFDVPAPMDRQDCINVIKDAGLPVPPKSACWFCPFHRLSRWQEMRSKEPALFWQAVELEKALNERREMLGKDPVWFSTKLKPLDQATSELEQASLFQDEMCDSGYCFV